MDSLEKYITVSTTSKALSLFFFKTTRFYIPRFVLHFASEALRDAFERISLIRSPAQHFSTFREENYI